MLGTGSLATVAAGTLCHVSDAQTAPSTATSTPIDDAILEARVQWLETTIARPLPAGLRQRVKSEIAGNDASWRRGRQFSVPDGTEPALIFSPVAAPRASTPGESR